MCMYMYIHVCISCVAGNRLSIQLFLQKFVFELGISVRLLGNWDKFRSWLLEAERCSQVISKINYSLSFSQEPEFEKLSNGQQLIM